MNTTSEETVKELNDEKLREKSIDTLCESINGTDEMAINETIPFKVVEDNWDDQRDDQGDGAQNKEEHDKSDNNNYETMLIENENKHKKLIYKETNEFKSNEQSYCESIDETVIEQNANEQNVNEDVKKNKLKSNTFLHFEENNGKLLEDENFQKERNNKRFMFYNEKKNNSNEWDINSYMKNEQVSEKHKDEMWKMIKTNAKKKSKR